MFENKIVRGLELKIADLTDPPQIFDAHLLENINLSTSSFHFSVGFISRSCFESLKRKNDVYSTH